MKPYVDSVHCLSRGDSGKGKIAYKLGNCDDYDIIARSSGAQNCGHTVIHNEQKFVTHIIPQAVFHNKLAVIGPLCYFNVKLLWQEIDSLEKCGINVRSNLKIAYNSHIVLDSHIAEEANETRIGTTKRGVGPCARDKYARIGVRAESVPELKDYLVDTVLLFNDQKYKGILFEGAQGFWLDINSRDYPFTTSSSVGVDSVIASGVSPFSIRNIFGVIKAYDTYVGSKFFEPTWTSDRLLFEHIRNLGAEFGSTTGRPRQVNWLDVDELLYAARATDITKLYVNKCDVLEQVSVFKLYYLNELVQFNSFKEMQLFIEEKLNNVLNRKIDVEYGYAP